MNYTEAMDRLLDCRLVAILRGIPLERSLAVAEALYAGGVRTLEFTYDHAYPDCREKTAAQVRMVSEAFGDALLVGCGTVLEPEEVRLGYEAGARLIVSPNTDREVIACTRSLDMLSMPGALTPTEIVDAHRWGASVVKLFPAGSLGVDYVRAVLAPLRHIPMSAVGGIKPENAAQFLNTGICSLGVGGEMVNKKHVEAGDMAAITARAREFVTAIEAWKEKNA